MRMLRGLLLSAALIQGTAFTSGASAAEAPGPQLITYPGPAGLAPSPLYVVSVSQTGPAQPSFVYTVNNIGLVQFNWQHHAWNNRSELTTAWTSFDFNDPGATFTAAGTAPVTVTVAMTMPNPAWGKPAVRVLPSASQVVPSAVTQIGNRYVASFQVHFPTQYSVEFYDAASHPDFSTWVPANPLLIFANPIELDVPDPASRNVKVVAPGDTIPVSGAWGLQAGVPVDTLYFTPGIYDLGKVPSSANTGIYVLHSNQSIYVAGGAYIKGAFVSCPTPAGCSDARNIRIRGRGIISGENFKRDITGVSFESIAADVPAVIQLQGSDESAGQYDGEMNAAIEGVTIIQAPFDNIELTGIDNWVNDVKVISWYPSTDGIKAGLDYKIAGVEYPGNGVVENSFLKDGDDSIHLYSSGLRVNNVVIWQSTNASPFEFGSGTPGSIDDVQVIDSNVIHTEWSWPNMANAVFAANLGGGGDKGYSQGYKFDEIHVENSAWQLFRLSIGPTVWQFGNTELGSLSNVSFSNLFVTDAQKLPSLFKGYDPLHPIANLSFDNVVVAGAVQSQPVASFDANRFMSLSGDIVSEPLWFNTGAALPNVEVWRLAQGMPTSSPVTSVVTLDAPFLQGAPLQLLGQGDFFGDGYASALFLDSAQNTLGIWAEPLGSARSPAPSGYSVAADMPAGYRFAGIGDFAGAGLSEVLLWSDTLQQGLIMAPEGAALKIAGTLAAPDGAARWEVVGVADFDLNGVSDVVFRDSNGDLAIEYLNGSGLLRTSVIPQAQLGYTATASFAKNDPGLPQSGSFDATWQVAGMGAINNYAAILWTNALGELGLTEFQFPSAHPYGNVVALLPPNTTIQSLGDYNGDGSVDLMLRDAGTGAVSIWYMGFLGGDYYEPAPATGLSLPSDWRD